MNSWKQELQERQRYNELHSDDLYKSDSQKQVDKLCNLIRDTGNDVTVMTKFGRIYVYLNGKEVQNVDAVQVGVDLTVSFLAGVWIGITNKK